MKQQPLQTFKSSQKSGIILVLFTASFLLLSFIIAGFIFAEKPVVLQSRNRLYQLFLGKGYQQLMQKLDKHNKVVLVGNWKDGLYIFIDYYASLKTNEGFIIKKRIFQPGEDLKYEKFPLLAKGYQFVKLQFGNKQTEPNFWIIETRAVLNTSDLDHIAAFAQAHPNHKFIVAANQTLSNKDTNGFKKIIYPRPTQNQFLNLLKDQKLSKILSKNIISYHNNSFNFLSNLVNLQNMEKVFHSYFGEQTDKINHLVGNCSKAEELLQVLCKKGSYPSKKQIKGISPFYGVIVYKEKAYFWSSLKYIYAYSNKVGKICDTNVKIVSVEQQPQQTIDHTHQEQIITSKEDKQETPQKTKSNKIEKKSKKSK